MSRRRALVLSPRERRDADLVPLGPDSDGRLRPPAGDNGRVFAGGNSLRDYGPLIAAARDIGAPIEFRTGAEDGVGDLVGQVVYAVPLGRLTYCVQPSPADPAVYLTWHLRGLPTGCVVRLEIDEPDAAELPGDEEETWLTLLAALQSLLSD